jgi:hypothetical protein
MSMPAETPAPLMCRQAAIAADGIERAGKEVHVGVGPSADDLDGRTAGPALPASVTVTYRPRSGLGRKCDGEEDARHPGKAANRRTATVPGHAAFVAG